MLVSVIMPVYNVTKYLKNSVQSVVNQTHKQLEIILIDDGSTDGSDAVCDELADLYSNIQVIHMKHQGPGAARNMGMKKAKGEYLLFVDSDDEIETNMIEILLKACNDHKVSIAACGLYPSYKQGCPHTEGADMTKAEISEMSGIEYLRTQRHPSCCCVIFQRAFVNRYHFVENKLCEDTYFMSRLCADVERMIFVGKIKLYFYLKHSGSIMQNFRDKSLSPDMAWVTYKNYIYFDKKYVHESSRREAIQAYQIEQCLLKFGDTRSVDRRFIRIMRIFVVHCWRGIIDNDQLSSHVKKTLFQLCFLPSLTLHSTNWSSLLKQ